MTAVETKPRRYHYDRLLLAYLLLIFAVAFAGAYFGLLYLLVALSHLLIILVVVRITGNPPRSPALSWLRWLYPIFLMLPLHYEIETVAFLFYRGATFDSLILKWDAWLLRGHPHTYFADALPGPAWSELFHLLYLSYYFIVFGGLLYAWWHGRDEYQPGFAAFRRHMFVLMGSFCSYMLVFILLPAAGPLDDRFLRFHDIGILPPMIDFLYRVADSSGGAFPSSHIGLAVVTYLLLRPSDRKVRFGLIVAIFGLTISTIYGSFHYAVDALAGLLSGPVLYYGWYRLYQKLPPENVENPPVAA
ncbi:MAG: phosphatase PAP2 family protein [Candidatus Marinimicrobia bacterium]|nr:phosphatase PAP2 family protein [Candidatus Neomarinimicrobiota bacterium]